MRVTDMRGVDLKRYEFDADLTLTVLWMNADGTIYHRYGGRDVRGAAQWLSIPSMAIGMRASLEAHVVHEVLAGIAAGAAGATDAEQSKPLTLERVPAFIKRDRGECIHCHSVRPALYEQQLADGTWKPEMKWRFMPPSRVGLDLDRDDQRRVIAVATESAAAGAGLEIGDVLVTMNGKSIATATDVMFALDAFPISGGKLPIAFVRGDKAQKTELELIEGWKIGTAKEFSWRPFKWGLTPAPGFGGPQLDAEELSALGLESECESLPFAFRITYLVTWGENSRYGQAATKAGLLKDDILISIQTANSDTNQMDSLISVDHFHAWWRLSVKPGDTLRLVVLRGGERVPMELTAIE